MFGSAFGRIDFILTLAAATFPLLASGCSSSKAEADAEAPAFAGCNVTAASTKQNSITLSWTPGADNDTTPERVVYSVYVSKTKEGMNFSSPPWTFASADGTPVSVGEVTDLRPGTTYYFVCRARDRWLNEDQNTNIVSLTTQPDPNAGNVSFKSNLLPLVRDACAGECHVPGGTQSGSLVLTDSVAFKNLTERKATQGAKWPLVVPGAPEQSFLWVKLCPNDETLCPDLAAKANWTPSKTEEYMPPQSAGFLKPEQYKLFRDWIAQGALDN